MDRSSILFTTIRYLDAGFRYLFSAKDNYKYDKNFPCKNNVALILDKGMGDFLLLSRTLKDYIEFFGSRFYIIADSYNVKFFQEFFQFPKERLIILERNQFVDVEGQSLYKYKGRFTTVLLPMASISPRNAKILRILSPNTIYSLNKHLHFIRYSIYDFELINSVVPVCKVDDFYPYMHETMASKIITDYDLKKRQASDFFDKLDFTKTEDIPSEYCLVNLNANNKSLLLEKLQLIDILLDIKSKTDLDIVLVGTLDDKTISELERKNINCRFLNTFDFHTLVLLCRYAKLVLTPDTGIYHLAALVGKNTTVYIPTWSDINVMFEPYPTGYTHNAIRYIRKFTSCNECPDNGLRCNLNLLLRKRLYCVENLSNSDINEAILNWEHNK